MIDKAERRNLKRDQRINWWRRKWKASRKMSTSRKRMKKILAALRSIKLHPRKWAK